MNEQIRWKAEKLSWKQQQQIPLGTGNTEETEAVFVQKQCISGDEKAANIATTRKLILPKTAQSSLSSLPSHVPRGFPTTPPQMLQCSSPFWHPGMTLRLAPAAVSTHLCIHHTHQGRLIQGSQKRGLACEKGGVAPKICLSESKTKPR